MKISDIKLPNVSEQALQTLRDEITQFAEASPVVRNQHDEWSEYWSLISKASRYVKKTHVLFWCPFVLLIFIAIFTPWYLLTHHIIFALLWSACFICIPASIMARISYDRMADEYFRAADEPRDAIALHFQTERDFYQKVLDPIKNESLLSQNVKALDSLKRVLELADENTKVLVRQATPSSYELILGTSRVVFLVDENASQSQNIQQLDFTYFDDEYKTAVDCFETNKKLLEEK